MVTEYKTVERTKRSIRTWFTVTGSMAVLGRTIVTFAPVPLVHVGTAQHRQLATARSRFIAAFV